MTKMFKVQGANDEVTVCGCCGRDNLKSTVILACLDSDGNPTGEVVRYGTDCAARAAGWTHRDVTVMVRRANTDAAAAAEQVRAARANAAHNDWAAWLYATTGESDVTVAIQRLGGFAAARAAFNAR